MLRRRVLGLSAALVTQLWISGLASAQESTQPPAATPPAAEPAPAATPAPETPAPAVAQPAEAAPAATPAAKQERTEEIVVTGSRIRRKDLTTPAPVTVIGRDEIAASGKLSIGDFLQALPEQGNGINTGVNNGGDGSTRVNLRGVGDARTLVLVNGRRWMPGGLGADSSVDLNSIPSMAVERIEVLKDGASALYGSDAIAGVVNIITRRGASQSEASVYTGTSYQSDGQALDLNFTTGASGEKGSVLFSAGFFDQKATMANERNFSSIPYGFDGTTGTAYTAGSGTIPAGRTLSAGAEGTTPTTLWTSLNTAFPKKAFIWTASPGAGTYCGASDSGQTSCFRKYLGAGLPEAGEVGDGYNFQPDNYLVTPQQRIQLFSAGDVQVNPIGRLFFEAAFVNRQSGQDLAPEPLVLDGEGVSVKAANVYNPFGMDVFVRRRLTEFGRRTYRQDIDNFRLLGGIEGTLPETMGPFKGWAWDVNLNYGRSQAEETKKGNLYIPALAAALGPSMMVNGVPTCVSTPGDATTAIAGCVPLNLFGGPGSITPDQVTGLTFTGVARGTNQLSAIQANASGELFRLLADRPMGLAVGYEYRYLSGTFLFDPITEKGLTTGNKGQNTQGSYNVNEFYGELSVPIVSGKPYAEDVEATAAIRWFDYDTFGSDYTYKFGARWRPVRDVTLRGTYSTAFRAPSITELYQGHLDNFANVTDPCRGPAAGGPAVAPACIAQGVTSAGSGDTSSQLRSTTGGNPDLVPETAKTYTVGVVLEPRMVKNLTVTVDYYNLDIDKNISSFGESVILAGCYDGSNPSYCDLIRRNPATHYIDNILNLNANVGNLKTAGVDFAVKYVLPTPAYGRFGFDFGGTWLRKIDQTLADGSLVKGRNTFDLWPLNSSGGAGGTFPEWKFNAGVRWAKGALAAGVSTRFLGAFHECGDSTGDFSGSGLCYVDSTFERKVNSYHTEDVFLSYAFSSPAGRTSIAGGINNISNAPPSRIYNGFLANTDAYNYDLLGRYFYLRLTQAY